MDLNNLTTNEVKKNYYILHILKSNFEIVENQTHSQETRNFRI